MLSESYLYEDSFIVGDNYNVFLFFIRDVIVVNRSIYNDWNLKIEIYDVGFDFNNGVFVLEGVFGYIK